MRWRRPGWETEQGLFLPFGPSKHTWDSHKKGGSPHTLQQPERWAAWQKGRQIVCLPLDKEHWLYSTEMVSNMGFCIFWPKHGTTSPALISGEFLMSKWRILWRFQEKYRHPGQLSLSQATWEAAIQYIMACLGHQQSHWPRTKCCLSPMAPSCYCGWGKPAPQPAAHRTGMLFSHWADSDSPALMTRYPSQFSGSRANYFSCPTTLPLSPPFSHLIIWSALKNILRAWKDIQGLCLPPSFLAVSEHVLQSRERQS